jgi:hypothetical protein
MAIHLTDHLWSWDDLVQVRVQQCECQSLPRDTDLAKFHSCIQGIDEWSGEG